MSNEPSGAGPLKQPVRLFDWEQFDYLCRSACDFYEKSAPTVTDYVDTLYGRVHDQKPVQLAEITGITALLDDGQWMQPNYAANYIYHLMQRVGLDTTGQAGF